MIRTRGTGRGTGTSSRSRSRPLRGLEMAGSPRRRHHAALVAMAWALLHWLWRPGVRDTPVMRSHLYHRPYPAPRSAFAGYRFPPEFITLAVRWYLRFGLSYRDVEELLAERGIAVDHVTVYRWVQRFAPEFAEAARPCRHAPGNRWFADKTYVKVTGEWAYLYRAADQHSQV